MVLQAGNGHAIEFGGQVFRDMSIEGRMTVCNMAIEAGARVGLVGVDEKTIEYLQGRPYAPKGDDWDAAVIAWMGLKSDEDAVFDKVVEIDGSKIEPQVSWGTSPEMVLDVNGKVPNPANESDAVKAGWY